MDNLEILEEVIRYIEMNLQKPVTAEDISGFCHYSVSNLKYLFRRVFQYGMMDYVNRRKMTEAARELLETDRTVCEVAYRYGFESQAVFGRSFRKVWGETPGSYRKRHRFSAIFPRQEFLYDESRVFRRRFDLTRMREALGSGGRRIAVCFDLVGFRMLKTRFGREAGEYAALQAIWRMEAAAEAERRGDAGAGTEAERRADGGPEAEAERRADGGLEAEAERRADGGPEAEAERRADGGPEAEAERRADGGPEGGAERGADGGTEGGAERKTNGGTEAGTKRKMDGGTGTEIYRIAGDRFAVLLPWDDLCEAHRMVGEVLSRNGEPVMYRGDAIELAMFAGWTYLEPADRENPRLFEKLEAVIRQAHDRLEIHFPERSTARFLIRMEESSGLYLCAAAMCRRMAVDGKQGYGTELEKVQWTYSCSVSFPDGEEAFAWKSRQPTIRIFFPDGESWCRKTVYAEDGTVRQERYGVIRDFYVDSFATAVYRELFLEIVYSPDGRIQILNEGELKEAVHNGVIGKAEYTRIRKIGKKLSAILHGG